MSDLTEQLAEVLLWEGDPEAKLLGLEDLGRQVLQHIARLEAELAHIRGLVQCVECSEELGSGYYHGWMSNLCPGCQGAIMANPAPPTPTRR